MCFALGVFCITVFAGLNFHLLRGLRLPTITSKKHRDKDPQRASDSTTTASSIPVSANLEFPQILLSLRAHDLLPSLCYLLNKVPTSTPTINEPKPPNPASQTNASSPTTPAPCLLSAHSSSPASSPPSANSPAPLSHPRLLLLHNHHPRPTNTPLRPPQLLPTRYRLRPPARPLNHAASPQPPHKLQPPHSRDDHKHHAAYRSHIRSRDGGAATAHRRASARSRALIECTLAAGQQGERKSFLNWVL